MISDVTSPVKLVGKNHTIALSHINRIRLQASSGNSDSANWPGYEAEFLDVSVRTYGPNLASLPPPSFLDAPSVGTCV